MTHRSVLLICLCLLVSGCGTVNHFSAQATRSRMNNLGLGMTKDEVLRILGEPYKKEAYEGVEYWLYYTQSYGDFVYGLEHKSDLNFTPVAFIDGKVDGWGRNYYEKQRERIEAEITIKGE